MTTVYVAVATTLVAVNVWGAYRSRPLRLNGLGWMALLGAVASSLFILTDVSSASDGARALSFIYGAAGLTYLIASPMQPLRYVPSVMLAGFQDEQGARDHDEHLRSHQWRIAVPAIIFACAAGVIYAFSP